MAGIKPEPFTQMLVTETLLSSSPRPEWTSLPLCLSDTEAFSLVFLIDRQNHKVLLGTKKRGYGQGLVHGFGGKIHVDESIEECARRELWVSHRIVETSFSPGAHQAGGIGRSRCGRQQMRKGRLVFVRPRGSSSTHRAVIDIALFVAQRWEGVPVETDEMSPAWYPMMDLPLDQMWPDVRLYWPPLIGLIDDPSEQQLLVRVDYETMTKGLPSAFPPLSELGIIQNDERYDEAIAKFWVAKASLRPST